MVLYYADKHKRYTFKPDYLIHSEVKK